MENLVTEVDDLDKQINDAKQQIVHGVCFTEHEVRGVPRGGCSRCPGTSLGQKMSGGEYRAKKLFASVKFFSAGEHPP